ncbi:LEAF RUST 10 DISEASE-RESISTANCE LOCUS RECEPTOR-LIKE PROTEIN KINASE-like 1.2 [Amaranthus tricolor]|uniref:LEAF RUST 10 DISEASE-RESISTANCE LOCUS RECEPTOR-LIKE PROTEIN KINASE-like 1.2 n=1 Tax=Amaranthus tricolor TaxID=29722 RepID=UPI002590710F|nr:LEAF RUST 10 DISEASE-RESISTANCE LOCUS RECEPTOR-LIKE PROTEIN KINASE-like 1.2 [Amaranthus tricolor]
MSSIYNLLSLLISILFFLIHHSLAIDDYFRECEPRVCGTNTITYPFYIRGEHKSFCGLRDFEVTCNSLNHTIINVSGDEYAILKILYQNQSMNVINNAFLNLSYNCDAPIHNFTLDDKRFEFSCNKSEIYMLHNCNMEARKSIRKYNEFSCVYGNKFKSELLIYAQQMNWRTFSGKCEKVVAVPYEGRAFDDIVDVLKSGFQLKWKAANCSECSNSGGRCGYRNETSSEMQCFCPRGVYARTCASETLNMFLLLSMSFFSHYHIVLVYMLPFLVL